MAEDPSVEVPVEVLIQRLPDDESVLLNLATEEYFGLDATGTAMWDALVAAGRVDEARAQLLERFDVSEEVLRRDLHALVVELARKGLLRLDPEPTPQRDDRS